MTSRLSAGLLRYWRCPCSLYMLLEGWWSVGWVGKAGDRRFFFSPRIISVGTGIPAEDVSWVARVRWDTAAATRGEIPRAATASHVRIGPQSSSEPTQNDTWEMRREWPRNNTCAMVQHTTFMSSSGRGGYATIMRLLQIILR
jgi:hypothetical protein